jgi:hypothetical protein
VLGIAPYSARRRPTEGDPDRPMFAFALFFRALAVGLETSRLLWLEPMTLFSQARGGSRPGTRRFYFDVRIGGSVIRDDIGAFSLSEDDAMADAVEALDEIGHSSKLQSEDLGADEIIVRDDVGREVGRIDLSRWHGRS